MKRRLFLESNQPNFESISKRLPQSFDHRHRDYLWPDDTRHRLVTWASSPPRIGTRTDLKDQFTTSHQVIVQKERLVVRLAVERRGLNVDIPVRDASRLDQKRSPVLEIE